MRLPRAKSRRPRLKRGKRPTLSFTQRVVAKELSNRSRHNFEQLVLSMEGLSSLMEGLQADKDHATAAAELEIFGDSNNAEKRVDRRSDKRQKRFLLSGEKAVEARAKQRFSRNFRRLRRATKWSLTISKQQMETYALLARAQMAFDGMKSAAGAKPSKRDRA